MPHVSMRHRLSRRHFMKGLGCLTGSLLLAPNWLAGSSAVASAPTFRIGVLLPRSNIYPAMSQRMLAGLTLGTGPANDESQDFGVTLLTEDIGFGSGLAVEKSRRFLDENVDLVVGLVSSGAVASLRDVFRDRPVPLVVANMGASVLRQDEHSPNFFHHSLGHWASNWAIGRWTAENLGSKALIASSFYDSGYDGLYAFRLGFELAGGQVMETCVTHIPPHPEDFSRVMNTTKSLRPDFVYASYCGPEAVDFVRAYASAGLAGHIPLTGSPFLTDEAYLAAQGRAALGIRTCFAWSSGLNTESSRQFAAAYRTETGEFPDAFALLGFETGGLIRTALDASLRGKPLINALNEAQWAGPRGMMRMDEQARVSNGPIYLREVLPYDGRLANVALAEVSQPPVRNEHFQTVRMSLKTGWLNAYLSV